MRNLTTQAGIYISVWMIGGTAVGIYALANGSVIAGVLMLLGAATFLGILSRERGCAGRDSHRRRMSRCERGRAAGHSPSDSQRGGIGGDVRCRV